MMSSMNKVDRAAAVEIACPSAAHPKWRHSRRLFPRDDDEGSGAILIFDRASLKTRYKLECHADQCWRDGKIVNEFEERVLVCA